MQYLVFDNMAEATDAEISRLFPLVSRQRAEYALRYKHSFGQFAALKSYTMLVDLLRRSGFSAADTDFVYNEHGKPFIAGAPDFSISHCRKAIAVAINEYPVGIDIETIRHADEALVRHTMNEAECTYIYGGEAVESVSGIVVPEPTANWAFSILWTQKEAVLKLKGTGIISDLRTALSDLRDIHLATTLCIEKGYVYTIATQNKQ